MAVISELSFTIVEHTGGEHVVRLKCGSNLADIDEEVDLDVEDTIIDWAVYLGREYVGKAQGTLVEAVSMSYTIVLQRLRQPQRYLQAKAEMRLDDEEPAEDTPPEASIASLFV